MFAKSFVVVSMLALTLGASVKLDTDEVQELIAKAVEDILREERIKQNERTVTILNEVDALNVRNDRLEERIKYLEQDNMDKERLICSLQTNMNDIIENVADKRNDETRNFSQNNPQEILNDCQSLDNKHFVNEHRENVKKRQISPTHVAPTPRVAFSAYLTHSNINVSPGSAIKFDHVLLNDGAGYSSYTGAFTAPVSGTYLFMFHFDTRVHTFVRLTVEGSNIVDALANPHVNSQYIENMSGNSAIIHVGIGQAVLVEVYDTVGQVGSSDKHHVSTFSGVLLYPETQ